MSEVHFRLDSDGRFVARRSKADVRITWDPRSNLRWHLRVDDGRSGAVLLDKHHASLDEAFEAAGVVASVTRVGWRDLIRIEIGDGHFHRPGSLPAETVLDRHGYAFIDSLQVFVLDSFSDDVEPAVVRRIFADRLSSAGAKVGSVVAIGTQDGMTSWCVDALLPVSGCFHRDALAATAAEIVAAADAGTFVSCSPVFISRNRVENTLTEVVAFARAG